MRKYRYGSAILAVLLLFSGCGTGGSTTETTSAQGTTTESTQAETETTEESTEAVYEEVVYNYQQELQLQNDAYRNVYEIFVYSFYDSDGDGIGDLNGVTEKLDYINDGNPGEGDDLEMDAIWLMPIMPSTTYHKYDVTDYYDIDPEYGTLEDFQTLLEEAHARGIEIYIDFVFNHTSAKHPWFQAAVEYLESLPEGEEPDLEECPYVGYYYFTQDSDSPSYYQAGNSSWYYEGVFWDQMPDLNLDNPLVREEIEKAAKYWLDMGVDGFRLDAAKEYFSGDTGKNTEVLQWFSDYVTSVKEDAYLVAEVWDTSTAISNYYQSGIQSIFNFPVAQYNGLIVSAVRKLGTTTGKSFVTGLLSLYDMYSASNSSFMDAPFVSNHDTTRISAQCVNNLDQMKMSAGVLLTMSGSPYVYYGEEIGMNSQGSKDENKRLPMQWSATDLSGMTDGPEDADEVEQTFAPLDEQMKDPLSLYNYYKSAIRLRNENPELARGTTTAVESLLSKNIGALQKTWEDSTIYVVYNFSAEASTVDLTGSGLESTAIRGYLSVDGTEVTLEGSTLEIPAYGIVILK